MRLLRAGIAYGVIGGIGLLMYALLFAGLVEFYGHPPAIAATVAFFPGLLTTYYLNHRFVFLSRRSHREALPRYLAVTGLGFAINSSSIFIGSELLGWWYGYAQLPAIVLIPVSNFLLSRMWVFADGVASN
jgi:putative flippase GtrA